MPRKQDTTVMTALCAFISVLLVAQLWLVTASLEALLGGDHGSLGPAAIASAALFLMNAGLMWGGLRFDHRSKRRA